MTDKPQERERMLEAFRDAMRHVAATVYVVTSAHEGQRFGIIATAVNSLSFDPPSLLACINRNSSLHDPLLKARTFTLNVMGLANRDVAEQFMQPGQEDRFAVGEWIEVHGVPVLATAQSSFVCRLADSHEYGTHSIIIGELLVAKHREDATPLTYFDRHYIDISEAPEHIPD